MGHHHHHHALHRRHPGGSGLVRFLEDPGAQLGGVLHVLERIALVAGLFAAGAVAVFATALILRLRMRTRLAASGTVYRLRLPDEFDRARLAQVLAGAAASLHRGFFARRYLGFELRAEGSLLEPLVFASGGVAPPLLASLIGEAIPGAQLVPLDSASDLTAGSCAMSFVPATREQPPLRTDFAADPAGLVARLLADMGGGAVQLLFAPAPGRARARLRADAARLRRGKPRRSPLEFGWGVVLGALGSLFSFFDPPQPATASQSHPAYEPSVWDRERAQALERKAAEPLFACSLRLAVMSSAARAARAQLAGVAAAYAPFRGEGGLRRGFEFRRIHRFERRLLPLRPPLLLSASELAALCPFPERPAESALPLEQAPARELLPAAAAPKHGLVIGESGGYGRCERIYVSAEGLLQHAHVLGGTGAGKSTLLLNLTVQAMEAGLGLALVEPKGDLVAAVAERVPETRVADVVLLDFGDRAFPPAFNLLAGGTGQGEAVAAIFSRLFGSNWGPRSDDLLRAAILTLEGGHGEGEVPTLAEVLPLLQDPRRRSGYAVIDAVVLRGFWQAWERFSEGQRQQALAPLANKLRAFLLRPAVRDALVQPEAPDLRSVIRERKILLCSLPAGALDEDGVSLFGSVLLHRLWQAAQALGPANGRRPFLCFVDEAHRFAALPGGMSDVLAQARGYGLGFLLAHQDLSQLSPELRHAVAANCRTKICFQLDPPDNERMAKHFEPRLTASDLLHLDRFQLAARLFEHGLSLPPATATALAPPEPKTTEMASTVRMYAHVGERTMQEVEALICERFPELEPPAHAEVAPDASVPPAGTRGGTTDVPPDVPVLARHRAARATVENSDDHDDEEDPCRLP